jgi:hypothetical protein
MKMNKTNVPEPDLDNLLKQALKDDLPPEAEARMNRQFLNLKRALDGTESLAEPNRWLWARGAFRKEILAFVSAVMLILGGVMHLRGPQSALAHSIEQLKVIVTVSMSLNRAAFMDCTILKRGAGGENSSYRVLWRTPGDVRMDMVSANGTQTIWISNETISFADSDGGTVRSMPVKTMTPGPVWQPALEFMTPTYLAKHMEEQYGLMQRGERSRAGSDSFLLVGREDRQVVEITVDPRTYLPKGLKKYALDSGRTNGDRVCLMEVRFHWNQPTSGELFVPGPLAEKQLIDP